MILGKVYEFVDKNRKFPFGCKWGAFIGYTQEGFPQFTLNVRNSTQCFVNAQDNMFEEVVYHKSEEQKIWGEQEQVSEKRFLTLVARSPHP